MRRWVYTVAGGLALAGLILGTYELAGGDATIVVLILLLATLVMVRMDRVEDLFRELVEEIEEAQATCGEVLPLAGGQVKECVRRTGHADPWHRDRDGVQWIRAYGGGGAGGSRLGDTEPQA